jgi:ABC-type transporter Mla subunit MlaD
VLPGQLDAVNNHLADVDRSLVGLPTEVASVNSALATVHTDLGTTRGTLSDTGNVLAGTAGSLRSIDGTLGQVGNSLHATGSTLVRVRTDLAAVRGLAAGINSTLQATHSSPNTLDNLPVVAGAKGIYERVAIANDRLRPVLADTGNILAELTSVNGHLHSTCEAPLLQTLGLLPNVPDPTSPPPRYGAIATVGTPC